MRYLYSVCPERSGGGKRLITVVDGTHNDTWDKGGQKYLRALDVFVTEVRQKTEETEKERGGVNDSV